MSRMQGLCGSILMVLIAMLVAGMFYGNTNNTTPSWSNPQPDSAATSASQESQQRAQCSNPSGLIGDSSQCDYETVGKLNLDFSSKLHEIVNMPFFRYFKVNLYKECPFWNNAGLCMNEDCSVETMDRSKVPEQWRAKHLAKVSISSNPLFGAMPVRPPVKEQDFCIPDSNVDEVYVDLRANPERFTGYSGPSAAMVWKAIYEENCFDVSQEMTAGCQYCDSERARLKENHIGHSEDHEESNILVPPEPAPMKHSNPTKKEMDEIFSKVPKDKMELNRLVQGIAKDGGGEESCLEKRVYYRLISGLHTSISIHICDEWFNQTTGEWGPNLDCFISRVGMHPERLENIYFDYAVVLRAVSKISDFLAGYEYLTGDDSVDRNIIASVTELVNLVKESPPTFEEELLFHASQGPKGRQLKNQFRDHFRNVTRIMDCVGCEKCRLWGKVQTQGLGTALKILFSYDNASLQGHKAVNILSRSEIVTLINTFNRFSESISAIERFGIMYKEELEREQRASKLTTGGGQQRSFIKAPSKKEDDMDAIVYKALLARISRGITEAYSKVDVLLESKNITQHRTALRNLASWIPY
ncbi:hypothetical protein BGZ98_007922 [Dissophora globulifera]|nr:hypothetical protein BGZ98_007922 [Dissophora globulifera]